MRILQMIISLGFFGAENVLLELAKELKKAGHEPIVGMLRDLRNPHTELAEEAERQGLIAYVFPCKGRFDPNTFQSIRTFVKDHKIDLIHSHNFKSRAYTLIGTRGMKVGLTATCHNWPSKSLTMRIYACVDKIILRMFDRVIAVSGSVRDQLLNSGINSKKLAVIQNGIDFSIFKGDTRNEEIRRELGISERARVIGTVGRMTREKGHAFLLRAAKEVVQSYPDVAFVFVGDGPLIGKLKEQAKGLPAIFTGLRRDMARIYKTMDIFVLPSLDEGLPMVLLEAMAGGKPVIATRVGNVPEVIRNGENGLLVEPGDEKVIADAVLRLMRNKADAAEMGRRGRDEVHANFSAAKMAEQYVRVYMEILNEVRRR